MNKEHIKCPICAKANTWRSENKYKPFCSDRCKLIDLGEWASETRAIPSSPADFSQSDDSESTYKHDEV